MLREITTKLLLLLLRIYQWTLSPIFGGRCRFSPSCSVYAVEAIQEYGPWRGSWMALWRILRCHPLAKGGYDPVAPKKNF
ncbi:MAG TPA: membrane protein insertion efficiency factor YidD [Phycisphaerae bacterium]|nr:membrane protein insertion efficiency factor YidD [Phycisphaerae bacterium]